MKSIKLLIVIFLFSSLLAACGMKGPLYRAPAAQPESADTQQAQTEQDNYAENSKHAVTKDLDNGFKNTTEGL